MYDQMLFVIKQNINVMIANNHQIIVVYEKFGY